MFSPVLIPNLATALRAQERMDFPLTHTLKTTALFAIIMLSGCTPLRVEPLALLQGQTEAVVFSGRDPERKEPATVSVEGLPEILARATWVEGSLFHKGGTWVRFEGGREVFLLIGFDAVLVNGTPGHFKIRKEDQARYRELTEHIRKSGFSLN